MATLAPQIQVRLSELRECSKMASAMQLAEIMLQTTDYSVWSQEIIRYDFDKEFDDGKYLTVFILFVIDYMTSLWVFSVFFSNRTS